MTDKTIALCGASGLVGRECLRLLLADPAFERVVVLARRPLPLADAAADGKLEQHVVDFGDLEAHAELLRVDQILCALGTTIKKAGSQERFREVDFGYPLALARIGERSGVRHFLLVSAVGANPQSRVFYSRVKGELEDAISALSYRSLTMVRPSLLLGARNEFRLGEEIGKWLAPVFPPKYKPVTASAVATVLVQAAREDAPGRRIIDSAQIRARRG